MAPSQEKGGSMGKGEGISDTTSLTGMCRGLAWRVLILAHQRNVSGGGGANNRGFDASPHQRDMGG